MMDSRYRPEVYVSLSSHCPLLASHLKVAVLVTNIGVYTVNLHLPTTRESPD